MGGGGIEILFFVEFGDGLLLLLGLVVEFIVFGFCSEEIETSFASS